MPKVWNGSVMVRIKEPRLGLLVAHTGRVRYGPAEQTPCCSLIQSYLELFVRLSIFCIYVLQTF